MHKLSPMKTYFTLLKGFVCTGVLYLPKNISNGGWAFSAFGLFVSYVFTAVCMIKLLEAKKKAFGDGSFTDIGFSAYGMAGKRMVEVLLAFTQISFVMAYIYFICS